MSARNYGRSTRVEDYYSDEDTMGPLSSHQNTPVMSPRQQHQLRQQSPKFAPQRAAVNRNSRLRNRYNDPEYYEEESLDEEELQRAMYEFGLEDRPPSFRNNNYEYYDQDVPQSPGYFIPPPPPPSRFMNDEEMDFGPYYPMPPHLQERYAPPPPPPPPPHWLQQRMRPDNNDMIMYNPQSPMDLPFAHRSASSRSYNRRNRPNQRLLPRRNGDFFPSHDDEGFDNDVNEQEFFRYQQRQRPILSRQNSNGSNGSRRNVPKRRANSLSGAPMMMDGPPLPPPPHSQQYPRRIHSDPNSPQNISSESSDDEDEFYIPQYRRDGRPLSMVDGRPPINDGRPLGRSLSFQGYPQQPPMAPPQPNAPLPPQMMMHPPPAMAHPNMMDNTLRRNNSMFNLASGTGGDFFGGDPMMNNNPTQQISPTSQGHENNGSNVSANGENGNPQMGHWMGPLSGFPTSPGNSMFNPQQNLMNQPGMMNPMMPMGLPMFNNPMMPPPPQQPMWNFMNPQDMWFGQPDFPLPFMNSSDPNLIINTMNGGLPPPSQPQGSPGGEHQEMKKRSGQESEMNQNPQMMPKQNEMMNKSNEMMMPPPPEPMIRRGLSLLGGLFGSGGGKRNYPEEYHQQQQMGFPPGNFSAPIQGHQFPKPPTKKEERLAREYQKLGSFWCWRVAESEDTRFQSFNIANQKIIKRKGENPESRTRILLGKEKKLQGDIMVDLNQFRGGCMTSARGQNQFLHLEIKEEPFEGNSSLMFDSR